MKTEVYSWRVSAETKAALDEEARRERSTVAAVLDRIAGEWLDERRRSAGGDDEQARLHAAAACSFGKIAGGDPRRSERARDAIRRRLAQRHAGHGAH